MESLPQNQRHRCSVATIIHAVFFSMLITAIIAVTSQKIHAASVELAQLGNSLEIQCPPDLVLCPSQSTDPSATGYPTVLTSCLPVDQLTFTYYDQHDGNVISREWAVYDPKCAYAQFCTQQITVIQQDDPTMVITDLYGGLVTRFEAVGTHGTIVNATWNFNGVTLTEGNGVHFLNDARSSVEIDFTIFPDATPGDFYNVFVSVQTSCTAQGGAGAGGAVPPLYTLGRGQTTASSTDVSVANTVVTVDCNGSQIAFDAQSRWFRFQVADAGLASVHVTNPTAHLAALQPGTNPALPQSIACGIQDIQFPAEAGKTYIIVVSGETSFTLSAQSTLTPPQIRCPPDVSVCPSDSTDPNATGIPTIISACSAVDQVQLTYQDESFAGGIRRTWTAIDPLCGASDPCVQIITVFQQDNPTMVITDLYGGLISRFEAVGSRGTIVNATWSFNGNTLVEGNGVHFLDAAHSGVEIDFTLFTAASPGDAFNVFVSVQTSCTAQGGAGGGGTVPPLYTLNRGETTASSSDVDFANIAVTIDCQGTQIAFDSQSRWFRFKVTDSGVASIHVTNPAAHVAALQPGTNPATPVPIACGVQDIQFPAEVGKTYIIVVTGEASFTLSAQSTLTPPQIQCPPDVSVCASDSTDPNATGIPSIISACSAVDQVQLTHQDETIVGGIRRTWTAIDPLCGPSDPCVQVITIFQQDNPVISASSQFSGLIVTFRADGTRRPITSANWNIKGIPLVEGNGVHFLNATHKELTVDFTIFTAVAPAEAYNIHVDVQTECAGGGAGFNTSAPPIYTLSRSQSPTVASTDVDVANSSIDVDCAGTQTAFGAQSRWFRFKIADAQSGLVTFPSGNPDAHLTALAPGTTPTRPLSIACGTGSLQFLAESAQTYIVVVDAADNFVLTPTMADLTRIIDLLGNLAFGDRQVGATTTATLTITNSGNSPLTINSIAYPPGFSGDWAGVIEAGASRDITVSFTPAAPGAYGGNILVDCDSTSGNNSIPISGAGLATRIISLSGDLAFGAVKVGDTKTATLTITNSGNSTLTISNVTYPTGFTGNWPGGTIDVGGSQDVTVTFNPSSPVPYAGQIFVASDATAGDGSIYVSASGYSVKFLLDGITFSIGGTFHFSLFTKPGNAVILEASTDLSNWSEVARFHSILGEVTFDDPFPTGAQRRFYRFRVE